MSKMVQDRDIVFTGTASRRVQEAQLPQRNRMTCYVSKFMLCFTRYRS